MKKILSLYGFVAGGLIAIFSTVAAHAEVRSGIWIIDRINFDSVRSCVDFSELTPFCSAQRSVSQCSLRVADCFFRYGSVIAPYGVCYDSAMSAHLRSFVLRKTIDYDREALFYLDSMVKQYGLKVPQGEYRDSISINNSGAFFVKTSENRYAVMIQVKMLIGDAFDLIWYYWAYQPDSGTALSKNKIFEQPASLTIAPDVFSGRPNPVFSLTDSTAIAEITHAIYVSVNTLLDSTIKRADTTTCNSSILGYRKMSVMGMFPPDNPVSSYMPSIELCIGKMTYYKVSPALTVHQPVYLYDKNSKLEKLIIRICCEKNLSVTDEYGTVKFCDVVPDSLKTCVSRKPTLLQHRTDKPSIQCRVRSHEICLQFVPVGLFRIDCFSLSGKCLASIISEGSEKGDRSVDLRDYSIGTGAYIVKLFCPGQDMKNAVFPVFIYR